METKGNKSTLMDLKNKLNNKGGATAPVASPVEGGTTATAEELKESTAPVQEPKGPAGAGKPAKPNRSAGDQLESASKIIEADGWQGLAEKLKEVREQFSFEDGRIVYVDDDVAGVLELLRKKGKIKTNLLISYLLQSFIEKNKEKIQQLEEKKRNKFLG